MGEETSNASISCYALKDKNSFDSFESVYDFDSNLQFDTLLTDGTTKSQNWNGCRDF
jgi:hypothetical protein